MSTRLETRYRWVLRLLPAAYRQVWEEEMVAAFLESMERDDPEENEYLADYGRPSWSEVASVLALAVRLRLGGAGGPGRYAAWGEAIRLVALIGLLWQAAGAFIGVTTRLWLAGQLPWLPAAPAEWALGMPSGIWRTAWQLSDLIWLPAYLALLFGHRRVAQGLAALALLPALVGATAATIKGEPFVVTRWSILLFSAFLVAALVAFHGYAPPVRRRPWLIALPAVAVVLAGVQLLTYGLTGPTVALLDWPALCAAVLVPAALVHLALPVLGRQRAASWSHALAVLTLGLFGLRLLTLLDYLLFPNSVERSTQLAFGAIQALVLLAVGGPLAVLAVRGLRHLPRQSSWAV